ncbi:MAG: EAL domain-containing protein [Terracidiphilus sp.]
MISKLKQSDLLRLATTTVAAVCGMLVISLLEIGILLRSAESKLGQDDMQILNELGSIQDESHTVLTAMNASRDPFCSDAEIAYFRRLIFNSEYLRDAGRMRDGRIECSTALGRENLPGTQFKPAASLPDGSVIYRDISPYQSHDEYTFGRQLGDSYVVLDPREISRVDSINVNRTTTFIDPIHHQLRQPGRVLPLKAGVVTDRNWQGKAGNLLLATRCDALRPVCVTTYITIPVLLNAWRGQLIGFTMLGGIIGALVGLVCALYYGHSRSMVNQLRRAIARDELRVAYQPIVNLASRKIVGAEALVSWTDEEGFTIGPDVFVKLAEERGFVGAITELVVRHALREFKEVLCSGSDFRLSINVTAADLSDPKFIPMLMRAVDEAGVPARSLAIEITESSTARGEIAMETIFQLRQEGYSVHIDDFGTGYSSLAYLHELSIDAIKIDIAFTQAIGTGSALVSILPQLIGITQALSLEMIVEGVETEEQADYYASASGQTLAQGWLFGRPIPAGDFHRRLAEDRLSAPVQAVTT